MTWSRDRRLREAQERLHQGDPDPMTEFLLSGDGGVTLENESSGATVHRETQLPTFLEEPWVSRYKKAISGQSKLLTRDGPRGFEIRARGPLYYLSSQRIEDIEADVLVAGINGNGKMKGAAPQAVLQKFGAQAELDAQEKLAKTDRSLGTAVFTELTQEQRNKGPNFLGHVVSTPKHTPESPGWLTRAVPNILELAEELSVESIAVVALGTSGGISAEDAAQLILTSSQAWFKSHPVALKVIFSLPTAPVHQAFEAEFRRQKIYFT